MSPAVGCMAVALLPKPLPLTISELSGAVAKRPGLLDVLLHHDLGGGFGLVLGTYQQNRLGAWAQGCGLWVSPFPPLQQLGCKLSSSLANSISKIGLD